MTKPKDGGDVLVDATNQGVFEHADVEDTLNVPFIDVEERCRLPFASSVYGERIAPLKTAHPERARGVG